MLLRITALLIFAFVLLPWGWARSLARWPQSSLGEASATSAWDHPISTTPGRH